MRPRNKSPGQRPAHIERSESNVGLALALRMPVQGREKAGLPAVHAAAFVPPIQKAAAPSFLGGQLLVAPRILRHRGGDDAARTNEHQPRRGAAEYLSRSGRYFLGE